MIAGLWFLVMLVSGATAVVIAWPLRRRVATLESMCEMLAKAVQKEMKTEG